MDIYEILTDAGIETEAAKKAERAINKAIPLEFVKKDQYNKKVSELDEAARERDEARADLSASEGYKQKYEDEVAAHRQTKVTFESEKTATTKRQALHRHLQKEGANPKLIDLLESKFDLSALELDGDSIKDWDTHAKPVKEQYAEVFGTVQTQGVQVAQPPANMGNQVKSNLTLSESAAYAQMLNEDRLIK